MYTAIQKRHRASFLGDLMQQLAMGGKPNELTGLARAVEIFEPPVMEWVSCDSETRSLARTGIEFA